MSNPVPVGSPRKSAAIVPFVNETLTSGLPIGSGRKWLGNWAHWLSNLVQFCAVETLILPLNKRMPRSGKGFLAALH
jgi:hypothetical protein